VKKGKTTPLAPSGQYAHTTAYGDTCEAIGLKTITDAATCTAACEALPNRNEFNGVGDWNHSPNCFKVIEASMWNGNCHFNEGAMNPKLTMEVNRQVCIAVPKDCVIDDVATKASCPATCGKVTAVAKVKAAYNGAACSDYDCQVGDGSCVASTTSAAAVVETTTTSAAAAVETTTTSAAKAVETTTTSAAAAVETTTTTAKAVETTTTSAAKAAETTTTSAAAAVETTTTTAAAVETTTTSAAKAAETTTTSAAAAVETTTTSAAKAAETTTTSAAAAVETTTTSAAKAAETTTTSAAAAVETTTSAAAAASGDATESFEARVAEYDRLKRSNTALRLALESLLE
jgi:hypothetical protein